MEETSPAANGVKVFTGTAADAADAATRKGGEVVGNVADATKGAAGDFLSGIDFGSGSWALAAAAFVVLVLVARGNALKARGLGMRFATSAVGATGFFVSWWAGLLTVSLALGFRWAHRSRHPVLYTLATAAALAFAGSRLLLWADPNAWDKQRNALPDGANSAVSQATEYGLVVVIVVAVAFLLVGALRFRSWYKLRAGRRRAYWDAEAGGMLFKGGGLDPQREFSQTERFAQLHKQGGRCNYSSIGCDASEKRGYTGWQGDHIYPYSKGGATVPRNLQTLCAECNRAKSAMLDHEARVKLAKVLPHGRK